MIKDITQNVIVDFKKKGDAEAARAVKELDKTVDGLKARIKETTTTVKQFEDTFTKAVAQGPSVWGKFSAAIGGAAKAMAPLNQAFELGGKAIRLAEAGLDAYAKTSKRAQAEVKLLKDEFASYRDTFLAGVGAMTVGILKQADGYKVLLREQLKVSNPATYDKFFNMDGSLKTLTGKLTGEEARLGRLLGSTVAGKSTYFEDLSAGVKGLVGELDRGRDHWDGTEQWLRGLADHMDGAAKSAGHAAQEAARWRAELAALSSKNAKEITDSLVTQLENERNAGTRNGGAEYQSRLGKNADRFGRMNAQSAAFEESMTRESRYAASATSRNESYLAKHFGELEEFDAYATAFNTLQTATTSAMNAWISGSMSLGQAIKKGIGDALGGLATQMAMESLKHGAYAIGSAAFYDYAGAAKHAQAALAFGVGAVAAAAAARSLGGGAAATAHAGGAGGGAGAGGGGPSYGNGAAQLPGERIIVLMGDSNGNNSPRMEYLNAKRVTDLAFGGDGVTNR